MWVWVRVRVWYGYGYGYGMGMGMGMGTSTDGSDPPPLRRYGTRTLYWTNTSDLLWTIAHCNFALCFAFDDWHKIRWELLSRPEDGRIHLGARCDRAQSCQAKTNEGRSELMDFYCCFTF